MNEVEWAARMQAAENVSHCHPGVTADIWPAPNHDLVLHSNIPPTVLGTQVGGDHYTSCVIQPIEYIWANGLGFSEGNVVKYITRWKKKGGIKDLEKAAHHINLLIEEARRQEARGVKYGLQSK